MKMCGEGYRSMRNSQGNIHLDKVVIPFPTPIHVINTSNTRIGVIREHRFILYWGTNNTGERLLSRESHLYETFLFWALENLDALPIYCLGT